MVSDSLNHASLVMGLRASGAHVKVFKHNGIFFPFLSPPLPPPSPHFVSVLISFSFTQTPWT